MKLTVVINTLNEEANIARAINSVKSLADEVVVVDMESADKTVEIAEKLGAKVYSHKKTNYVEPGRNFAISKATGDWILILDADEEVSEKLGKKIEEVITGGKTANYYRIPRKNLIFNKWIQHSGWWPDHNIRLFKKGTVVWKDTIHSQPETKGEGGTLPDDCFLIHHHYTDLDQYLTRLNRYTTIQADELVKSGYRFSWLDLLRKPVSEFLRRVFAEEGYKDGLHGVALGALQAFSELVVYLKVWQEEGFPEPEIKKSQVIKEIRSKLKEIYYWLADTLFKNSGGVVEVVRRKFKI